MAKLSFVLLSVFAVAFVAAQQVVREKNNNDGSGTFDFTYDIFWLYNAFLDIFCNIKEKKRCVW